MADNPQTNPYQFLHIPDLTFLCIAKKKSGGMMGQKEERLFVIATQDNVGTIRNKKGKIDVNRGDIDVNRGDILYFKIKDYFKLQAFLRKNISICEVPRPDVDCSNSEVLLQLTEILKKNDAMKNDAIEFKGIIKFSEGDSVKINDNNQEVKIINKKNNRTYVLSDFKEIYFSEGEINNVMNAEKTHEKIQNTFYPGRNNRFLEESEGGGRKRRTRGRRGRKSRRVGRKTRRRVSKKSRKSSKKSKKRGTRKHGTRKRGTRKHGTR